MPGAGVGTRLNAIFDLAKRWQKAKAARRVLGPWWNVLRAPGKAKAKGEKRSKRNIRPGKAVARSCTEGFRALVERASRRF